MQAIGRGDLVGARVAIWRCMGPISMNTCVPISNSPMRVKKNPLLFKSWRLDMRKNFSRRLIGGISALLLAGAGNGFAAETPASPADPMVISVTSEPARYSFVKGDPGKFRALHWMDDGFAFGAKDFSLRTELDEGVTVESEGHAIPEDGDYSSLVHIAKEDVGYLHFNFDQ